MCVLNRSVLYFLPVVCVLNCSLFYFLPVVCVLKVISYDGVYGGDEQGEPLDYFAYYDEGIIAKERREKEALEKAGGGKGEGGGKGGEGKEKPSEGGAKVGGKEGMGGKTVVKPSAKKGDVDMKEASNATAQGMDGVLVALLSQI